MRTLIEKCNEYKIGIVLIFIDFEKAFDSVETWSILDSLDECRVDTRYSNTIRFYFIYFYFISFRDQLTDRSPITNQS